MNLSGFTNIYSMFMLKSLHQLSVKGRAAYLVPSEFLNSDYGTTIKKLLLENGSLRFVILFDAKENVFDNALTTSCILLFSNDDRFKTVAFINAGKVGDLEKLSEQIANYPDVKVIAKTVSYSDLDPNVKWRKFYQKQNGEKFKNLVSLSAYGKVVRGIATGDNDYFTFDEKKKEAFGIDDKFLLPCLTKAIYADKNFFTQKDFDKLRVKGSRTFLFNALDTTNKAVREYIALGEKLEVNTRYLTSHRNPWYAIEHRPPAPILVTVFNRGGLRFVRNETNARNLTCFHCLYLNLFALPKQDLLMSYFLTDVSKEVLNDNRREYGGGLNKFEPNDLNKANVINLDAIDEKTESEIIEIYQEYRLSVLQSAPDKKLFSRLNDIYLDVLTK
jgi:adenine-specific DNA-methyltransferase